MATVESLLHAPQFANSPSVSDAPPQLIKDAIQLVHDTVINRKLVVLMDGERVEDLRPLLHFTASEMAALNEEQIKTEAAAQLALNSLTANEAIKWFGNSDKKTEGGDTPLFNPEASPKPSTLVTERQTLKRLFYGTNTEDAESLDMYLKGFAKHCAYLTNEQDAVIGYQNIYDSNIKNIKLAPKLTYKVNSIISSGNLGIYDLDNQLDNGEQFNLSSFNGVNIEGDYDIKIDNFNTFPAKLSVFLYMLSHIAKTARRLFGCKKTETTPLDLPSEPGPLPYSLNASSLARETFAKRNIVVFKDGEVLSDEQFLNEIEQTAQELSGPPLEPHFKTFYSQIQRNQKELTAYVAAKRYANADLKLVKDEGPLFNQDAESIRNLKFAMQFLAVNTDQKRTAELIDMLDEKATYIDSGHFATAGKENIAKHFASHILKTYPATINASSYTVFKNQMTATQTFTLADGEKFMVCYVVNFNAAGKITYIKEVFNRSAVKSDMFWNTLRNWT